MTSYDLGGGELALSIQSIGTGRIAGGSGHPVAHGHRHDLDQRARTAGSNLIIGAVFLLLARLFSRQSLALVHLIPMSVLGVLLLFAGSQLALTVIDLKERRDLFVVLLMLGITLASNLAYGFVIGMAVAHILRWDQLQV